jgi:hypothetical protein
MVPLDHGPVACFIGKSMQFRLMHSEGARLWVADFSYPFDVIVISLLTVFVVLKTWSDSKLGTPSWPWHAHLLSEYSANILYLGSVWLLLAVSAYVSSSKR